MSACRSRRTFGTAALAAGLLVLALQACASSGVQVNTLDASRLEQVRTVMLAPCNVDALTQSVCDSAATIAVGAFMAELGPLLQVPSPEDASRLGTPGSIDAPAWLQYARDRGADGLAICFVTGATMETASEESGDTFVEVDLRSGRVALDQERTMEAKTHWRGAQVTLNVLDVASSRVVFGAEGKDVKAFPADAKPPVQLAAAARFAAERLRIAIASAR